MVGASSEARKSTLWLKTASDSVVFVCTKNWVTLIVTGARAISFQIAAPQMGLPRR